ncbi:uncharacterized protein LOC130934617 [Arachis stenosperma]|uniref:uncharacterized protein LOC130934617 n=1 Tax=Arachis stenosperma TaxID=217475 RepID=UPI0025ACAE83|nr:uncharacterized protein LOC130934617 [Arachis stenosperma]
MGFNLWVFGLVSKGCVMNLPMANENHMLGAVTCGTKETDFRAKALANLQFSWILFIILIFAQIVCLKLARRYIIADRLKYERLHNKGTDSSMASEGFKQPK